MKTTEAKLLSFLQKSSQFVIPIYQRIREEMEGGASTLDIPPYVLDLLHQSSEQQVDDGMPA